MRLTELMQEIRKMRFEANVVYIFHSVSHSLGKSEVDFANSIALGFSALITHDDYVKSKI